MRCQGSWGGGGGGGGGHVIPSGGVTHPGGSEEEREILSFHHVLRCHTVSGECRERPPTLSFQNCMLCMCVHTYMVCTCWYNLQGENNGTEVGVCIV